MITLWYVVKKELQVIEEDFEITTGNKLISVYDLDTQSMQLVIVCEIDTIVEKSSEEEIQYWLDNNGYGDDEYKLEEL